MKLPRSFQCILRRIARYAVPVGTTTVLRGCPCPAPVLHPPAPYTSSLVAEENITLDPNPLSWEPYCQAHCNESTTGCYVHVYTSENNSLPLSHSCDKLNGGQEALGGPSAPWVTLCKDTCGDEQDCFIGPEASQNNTVVINCVSWWVDCAGGRSTEGITVGDAPQSLSAFGMRLARIATLEAEAVPAFRRLARELAALGAPRKLRRQAARSRRDEARHARTISSLARKYGSIPASVLGSEKPLALRNLEEVALENALEGCIRETYGAWQAWKQSEEVRDSEYRSIMQRIARDELRHAQLAWEIHDWAMKRLSLAARRRITDAMQSMWPLLPREFLNEQALVVGARFAATLQRSGRRRT
ncbi:MAG TPA: ferritin-like domain-containing protein [Polyangium sp.]|nr:ferritin-like domain-containing protein [Polyangium sp.]